jgi:cGMP-dependent protein kinase
LQRRHTTQHHIALADLHIRNTLGCGAFGRVKLCRLPTTDQFFALKCQAKKAIVESGLQEHILNEMRVMKKIDRPPFHRQAKLFAAGTAGRQVHLLGAGAAAGRRAELFTHLRNRGKAKQSKLTEQWARFYAATVVHAFSSLHAKRIAYTV